MAMTSFLRALPLAAALAAAMPAPAATTCRAASGTSLVPLVELFTSEGCDSCPPADRWLAAQFPGLRDDVSVLAFHVDYWDRLGWKDRFASAAYTARQYDAMRAGGATFVYTPQVLVQGRDAEFGRGTRAPALLADARRGTPRATVTLDTTAGDDGTLVVAAAARIDPAHAHPRAVLWLAYTESALTSDVGAGENRGARLTHDHVVRRLEGPYPAADGMIRATARFARPAERGRDGAVVAVVQDARTYEVLQTLTQPRCGGQ
ncbi:MAG: DUF1223 domain-containing protein [Burkholderiales bacterium]